MKRIFIAVGSAGTRALKELIHRLRDENMFDKFNDYYIAFDTDYIIRDHFSEVRDRLKTDRIQGYDVELSPEDSAVMNFNSDWCSSCLGPSNVAPAWMVKRAAACIRNVWNDVNLGLDANLQPDDHIIIVGSAFGHTSSGMFLNVCQYLDYRIREKRQANDLYSQTQILGFLLMPQGVDNPNYPSATNMIDLFRDLQTSSWQRRLESARPGFKVPVWAQYREEYCPLFTGNDLASYGINGSSLPMSTLYLVPTPQEEKYASAVYAETLFAASYLRICEGHSQWCNRLYNFMNPVATQVTAEDNCISGFNMFAMRSGRTRSIKNCFYKEIKSIIQGSCCEIHSIFPISPYDEIVHNIKDLFEKIQTPGRDDQYAGLENIPGSPLYELLTALDNINSLKALLDFEDKCLSFLNDIERTVKGYDVISAEGLIAVLGCCKEDWVRGITFQAIERAYNRFYADVTMQAANVNSYKEIVLSAINRALRMAKRRLTHYPVIILGAHQAVFFEIIEELQQKLHTLMGFFLFACRCKNTVFIDPQKFVFYTDQIEDACKSLLDDCNRELYALSIDDNPYIAEGRSDDTLTVLPGINFNPMAIVFSTCYRNISSAAAGNVLADNALVVKAITELGGDSNFLVNPHCTDKQIVQQAEGEFIVAFIEAASGLPDGINPLLNLTFANFDHTRHRTHAPELKVPDSNTFHHHFVIQLGDIPDNFSMTNDDVAGHGGALQISTMPNVVNGATQFLSVPHNNTGAVSSWSGHTPLDFPHLPHGPGAGPLFEGKIADIDIQGLWIGTLGIDFSIKDSIRKIYGGVEHLFPTWSCGAQDLRRVMTTVEMLKFGLIIEAIEEKFNEAWEARKANPDHLDDTILNCPDLLQISFSDSEGNTFSLTADTPHVLGFIDDRGLVKIRQEWIREIMGWLRSTDGSSFDAFFPGATFDSVRNTEMDIFNHMRFSIKAEEIAEMDALKNDLLKSLQISGI